MQHHVEEKYKQSKSSAQKQQEQMINYQSHHRKRRKRSEEFKQNTATLQDELWLSESEQRIDLLMIFKRRWLNAQQKYKKQLKLLEQSLDMDRPSISLQTQYERMLGCFQQFRESLIDSIRNEGELAIIQLCESQEGQRRHLQQLLQSAQTSYAKVWQSYLSTHNRYEDALQKKDPDAGRLKECLESYGRLKDEEKDCIMELKARLKGLDGQADIKRQKKEQHFKYILENRLALLNMEKTHHAWLQECINIKKQEGLLPAIRGAGLQAQTASKGSPLEGLSAMDRRKLLEKKQQQMNASTKQMMKLMEWF